jgi:hypothetical protein
VNDSIYDNSREYIPHLHDALLNHPIAGICSCHRISDGEKIMQLRRIVAS